MKPHNLDLFLEWRRESQLHKVPTICTIPSIEIASRGITSLPEVRKQQISSNEVAEYLSERYKILVTEFSKLPKAYSDNWRLIKVFKGGQSKGPEVYVFLNKILVKHLKKNIK